MCLILFPGSIMSSGLHCLKDVIPPSEACLYGHINWSLAQAEQQSSMGLSQPFASKRGGKAQPQTGFHFMVLRRPVPGSNGASLAKGPHLDSGNEAHPNLLVAVSPPVLLIPGGKRAVGVDSQCVAVLSLLLIFICSFSGWYAFKL